MKHNKEYVEEQIELKTNTAVNVLKYIAFGILGVLIAILFGFVIKFLWNALLPDIFGLPEISYWQGVGLLILSRILFGGFGSGSSSSNNKGTVRGEISHEIGSEIRKEIRKEMREEVKKELGPEYFEENTSESVSPSDNDDEEALYDQWWESEGEKLFENYMNKQ